jgi:hypothetical protein
MNARKLVTVCIVWCVVSVIAFSLQANADNKQPRLLTRTTLSTFVGAGNCKCASDQDVYNCGECKSWAYTSTKCDNSDTGKDCSKAGTKSSDYCNLITLDCGSGFTAYPDEDDCTGRSISQSGDCIDLSDAASNC